MTPTATGPALRPGRDWFCYVVAQLPDGTGPRPLWGRDISAEMRVDYGSREVVLTPLAVVSAAEDGEVALSATGFETRNVTATRLRMVVTAKNAEGEILDLAELLIPVETGS